MTPTLHLKLGVTLVTVFRGGLYRGMMRAGGGEGRFWQPRWQKFGGSKFITETLHWLFWRSCHILWMDCTFGFYLEIHILNPSPNLKFFIDQFWNILFCHFLNWRVSRNLSGPMTASAAHQVTEILSQKCEYCFGRGEVWGWQIICVPVKFRSVHRAEQSWYQLKQKPDQSHTGPGDLPGLSADVSDNNVSLSHYYIKIPLAPGHFPWRCGRFLSPRVMTLPSCN